MPITFFKSISSETVVVEGPVSGLITVLDTTFSQLIFPQSKAQQQKKHYTHGGGGKKIHEKNTRKNCNIFNKQNRTKKKNKRMRYDCVKIRIDLRNAL